MTAHLLDVADLSAAIGKQHPRPIPVDVGDLLEELAKVRGQLNRQRVANERLREQLAEVKP